MRRLPVSMLLCLALGSFALRADQLETTSGEKLVGKVLSLSEKTVTFQSDLLGKFTLARSNITALSLGTVRSPASKTNRTAEPSKVKTKEAVNPEIASAVQALPSNPGAVQDVTKSLLSQASPEATQKFNELLRGVMTGKITVADLRLQAKSLTEQVRSARGELGEEAGGALDSYLAILDKFLSDTAPAGTNRSN